MRCAICDKDDDAVTHINTDCRECQEVIFDCLTSYDTDDDEGLDEEEDFDTRI